MSLSTRRFFLPAALVLFVLLFSADRLAAPVDVKAAYDPSGPAWDPLSTFDVSDTPASVLYPPRLLAGTNSHALPASALSRNGYCLDVNIDGITPVTNFLIPASALGFRMFATEPIDPSAPAQVEVPVPTSGTYTYVGPVTGAGAAALNAALAPTSDDVYCVVAYGQPGYKKLTIEWHYQVGGSGDNIIALPVIPIINISLQKIGNGLVNAPAEVCTVGWDGAFLTGRTSNAPSAVDPDPVNEVAVSDFVISATNVPILGTVSVEYVRQVGPEWCAGIASTTNEDNLQVTFNFDAVYNRVEIGSRDRNGDDQPGLAASLPADKLIDIRDVVELRHVTADGQVPPRQHSDPLVLNSTHYVCLMGSDATDTMAANQVQFVPVSPPDSPTPSNLTVFHKTAAHEPPSGRLSSTIPNGTICFSFTSASPGEHSISATFTNNPGGIPQQAFFDSDSDGNGIVESGSAGPLIADWNRIDGTALTSGGTPDSGSITFQTIEVPLSFNLSDGTYLGGAAVTEWVLGSHTTGGKTKSNQLLNGALLRAEIVGGCGYFVVPTSQSPTFAKPTVIFGTSIGGRFELNNGDTNPFSAAFGDVDADPDDIQFSTLNAGGCGLGAAAKIQIDVFYPNDTVTPAAPREWVAFHFSFVPAMKVPRVAWAGEFVDITYAIASSGGSCPSATIHFVRPKGQPGSFMPSTGFQLDGPDHATTQFGSTCSATIRYESEDPGEVDIEVFIDNNPYSKVAFPIFFLLFEDLTLESTPDQFVSTFGDVTANVRGYFVGTNPSGRPAEVKPDGRSVPADRWVLPDDWGRLKGESNLRNALGSISMPPSIVTFFMENEGVANNYKTKVKNGAAGFFIPDTADDFSFNVNPHTKATTVLGTLAKPRMMSSISDGQGEASVDSFGDRNLSYEACSANVITGNPHCKPEDVAGRTRYYAVAEYPQPGNRGKFPAVASNVDETVWRWAGYKDVTIVNGDSPQIKYVVAHLRDRDGFCDAANYNNTLGVPVTFEIDAGDGVIIEAADRPYTINGGRRFATATTFDTLNLLDQPINTHIAKPPLIADQPDECQAWIKVTNSLLTLTNVTVTFPAPPSPVPGDIRITAVQCTGQETITVKNFGSSPVNLGGFSLESIGSDIGNGEQLDLIGVLQPGESATFLGGPGAGALGWLDVDNEVLSGPNDFVSLTWEDYPLTTVWCDGRRVDNTPLVTFPLDGEGEIKLDIIIPFGTEVEVPLLPGWNMVPTGKGTVSIDTAFAEFKDKVEAVYVWDAALEEWTHYIPGAPAGVNTIDKIGNGVFMWVLVKQPFTLTIPK